MEQKKKEQAQEITVPQVIGFTIRELQEIQVPCGLIPTVGEPIVRCIRNLQLCMDHMAQEAQAEKAAQEALAEAQAGQEEAPAAGGEELGRAAE